VNARADRFQTQCSGIGKNGSYGFKRQTQALQSTDKHEGDISRLSSVQVTQIAQARKDSVAQADRPIASIAKAVTAALSPAGQS
jgi:hypothetical protein